ncbi:uncharacterized protein METZ01_LOCUS382729, partial [marine metagenome]
MGIFLVTHVAVWRTLPSGSPRMGLLSGLAAMGVVISLLTVLLVGGLLPELFAVASIDFLLVVLYLFVYAGVARSVSLTLVARLLVEPGHTVVFGTLLDEYTSSSRFEDRLRLMGESGLLLISEDRVDLTVKG